MRCCRGTSPTLRSPSLEREAVVWVLPVCGGLVSGKQDRVTGLIGDSCLFEPSGQTTMKLPKQAGFWR